MGDTTSARLPAENDGDVMTEILQLTADFSKATDAATDNTIAMQLAVGNELINLDDISLSYTTQAAGEKPFMRVSLVQIDGEPYGNQVLEAQRTHTVRFSTETNRTPVTFVVERQTALKSFTAVQGNSGNPNFGITKKKVYMFSAKKRSAFRYIMPSACSCETPRERR